MCVNTGTHTYVVILSFITYLATTLLHSSSPCDIDMDASTAATCLARGTLSATRARGFSPVQLRAAVSCPPAPVHTLGPAARTNRVQIWGLGDSMVGKFEVVISR